MSSLSLQSAPEFFRALLETIPTPVVVMDRAHKIHLYNTAFCRQFCNPQNPDTPPENILKIVPEPHRSQHASYLQRYLDTGVTQVIGRGREVEALLFDGRKIPVMLSVGHFEFQGEHYFVGILQDLSATKELYKQSRSIDRAEFYNLFVAGLAHNLNNLVMILDYNCKKIQTNIQDKFEGGSETLQALHKVEQNLKRLQTLSSSLGPAVSFDATKDLPIYSPGHIARLAEALTPSHIQLKIQLSLSIDAEKLHYSFILNAITQLIQNAVDAIGPQNGEIVLSVEERSSNDDELKHYKLFPQNYLYLCVEDSGPGVADGDLEKIFDPFYSTREHQNRVGTAGLGLFQLKQCTYRKLGYIFAEPSKMAGLAVKIFIPILS